MDVDRTIEFILDSQAKAEVRMDRLEKQVTATANLLRGAIRVGAREVARSRQQTAELKESQRLTDEKLRELAQTFDAFLKNFGKTQNGD